MSLLVRVFGLFRFIGTLALALFAQPLLAQENESGEDIVGRQQYFSTLRAGGPGLTIPRDAYARAVVQHMSMPRDRELFGSPTATTNWQSLNPTGLFYAFNGASYISGRTNSIAFHPTDPNVIYIGAAGGGVWKTTDGGVNWTVLTDNLATLSSGSVAVDQVNPSVVYYGTGELNYSGDSYYGNGVYKSTDAGTTWAQVATTSVGQYISQISIDPTNSSVVYLSGSNGVYKSTNAGSSWSLTPSGSDVTCILIDPTNTQILYTAAGAFGAGFVKKSTNGGTSWTTLGGGLPTTSVNRIQLAMAPSNSSILYASIANSSYALLGVYRTTDGGTSWTAQAASPNYLASQGWYNNAVTVNPTNPNIVIVGGLDIYSSSTGGTGLVQRTSWFTTSSSNMSHADIHFLGYRGTVLYCGSDGGVYKSTNDGVTWSDLNATLSTLQFQSADYDPTNLMKLYGGTQDNNKETSTNGGTNWSQITTGDGGYTVVDPVTPAFIYGAYVGGSVQRSANSGGTYTEIRPTTAGSLFYNPYEMAPGDHNTIVYAVGSVWKTTSAQTATTSSGWTQIAASGTLGGSGSAIGISSTNINRIYVGTSNGRILSTTNNGAAWTTVTGFPYVTDLVVDPTDDNVCYATFSGFAAPHISKTTNGGTTWTSINGTFPAGIPVLSIALRTAAPRTLFLGTDLGVYKSTDDGATWASFNNGLATLAVFDLKYKESTQKLMAATHGRGTWMFDYAAFLPIQLGSFTATFPGNGLVHLAWTTITETNNHGFEVQKSRNPSTEFQTIPNSFVPGHGTTLQPQHYTFDDATARAGRWFYRLKQIDLDGTVHYVEPIQVQVVTGVAPDPVPTAYVLHQNYPNPFNPSTTISFDLPKASNVSLTVFNALGQQVASLASGRREAGVYRATWDAGTMSSGIYYYKLEADGYTATKKLLLVK